MRRLQKDETLLSRFSLINLLGEGGMGQVWLVRDLELQIHIAIKVLNPQLANRSDRVELLKNECRSARRLIHPHIVRIFDFHRSEDLVFISMEYVEGEDLQAYRRRLGILPYPEMITRLKPIVEALSYAHGMGVVHRDLKASNVLLDKEGSPRLADFGVAAVLTPYRDALQITSGGSLYFMSPQQLDGHEPEPSDDIYALGVLMYELLTGYLPFYPEISPEKIHRQIPRRVNETLERMNAASLVPESLDHLISRLLAKTPEERPSSLEEIERALQGTLNVTSHHTIPPSISYQAAAEGRAAVEEMEIIRPAEVPKSGASQRDSTKRQDLLKALGLVSLLLALLVVGGLLLHHLSRDPVQIGESSGEKVVLAPEKEDTRSESAVGKEQRERARVKPPAQLALEKERAEQKLSDFLLAKKALDEKGGGEWGGDLYAGMVQLGQEADAHVMARDYASAVDRYEEALAKADQLENQTEAALGRLLEEGRLALAGGDGKRAQHSFQVALMIDPSNAFAQHNLERAKKIEKVMGLMDSARRHEKSKNFPFALADYQGALRLDPESDEARMGFERVKDLIAGEQFQELMSSGFAALNKNNYEPARAAFQKAQSFKPDSREVQDALAQVDQAIRLARIETLRNEALAAEQAEDWVRAFNAYQAVLDLDATIQFAVRGKTRSMGRLELEKGIKFYLEEPSVLESDRHLENAINLLKEAKEMDPKGPHLMAQTEKLDQLITMAQTPVRVTLESDNLTEVAVYKVGRLGRFYSRDLNLRPGTYTVVGRRNGYKDVMQKIVVKAGQKQLRVAVKCEDKI